MQDVVDCFDRVEADDAVGCIVLTGSGDAWSAGFQLKEIQGADDKTAERVRRTIAVHARNRIPLKISESTLAQGLRSR